MQGGAIDMSKGIFQGQFPQRPLFPCLLVPARVRLMQVIAEVVAAHRMISCEG